ncbi:MAG: AMP-binding protein [Rubrivivax sp.]
MRDGLYAQDDQIYHEGTRELHLAPISHGSGLGMLPCSSARRLHGDAERARPASLVPQRRGRAHHQGRHGADVLIYRLLDLPEASWHDLSTLETITYGAAQPISPAKPNRRALRQHLRAALRRHRMPAGRGIAVKGRPHAEHLASAGGGARRRAAGSSTRPGGASRRRGATGEVWPRSRATISGYRDNLEGTAATWTTSWKSGDLGYVDVQGFLYIVDRKKEAIITGI